MNKRLPSVFANPIGKSINNVQETFYGKAMNEDRSVDARTILQKINRIFNSGNFVYKSRVRITTANGILEKTIVGRTELFLLTYDNETISIASIQDIEKIK